MMLPEKTSTTLETSMLPLPRINSLSRRQRLHISPPPDGPRILVESTVFNLLSPLSLLVRARLRLMAMTHPLLPQPTSSPQAMFGQVLWRELVAGILMIPHRQKVLRRGLPLDVEVLLHILACGDALFTEVKRSILPHMTSHHRFPTRRSSQNNAAVPDKSRGCPTASIPAADWVVKSLATDKLDNSPFSHLGPEDLFYLHHMKDVLVYPPQHLLDE